MPLTETTSRLYVDSELLPVLDLELARLKIDHSLRVTKTALADAVIRVGLAHMEEVRRRLEPT